MSLTIISYAPGAGGNHLKNMMINGNRIFANHSDFNIDVYNVEHNVNGANEEQYPFGTVHSVPGRNVQKDTMNKIMSDQTQDWIVHGHFGELAPYRNQINSVVDKKFILITIDNQIDQQLLDCRQTRLGHKHHSYYITEEEPLLYQPTMYETYFNGSPESICCVSLYDFWHPVINKILTKIENFLNIKLDQVSSQDLHTKWWSMNFNFDFDDFTRRTYG